MPPIGRFDDTALFPFPFSIDTTQQHFYITEKRAFGNKFPAETGQGLVHHFIITVSYRPKGDILYHLLISKISHDVRNDNNVHIFTK